jgi:uncharacterized protein
MSDLIVGLGLVLVIEGILWAAFPRVGRTMLEALTEVPEATLRSAAAAAVVAGVALVWLVRG